MAGYAGNSSFFGEIDGKNLRELRKMDMSKNSLKDRIESLDNILDSTSYFIDYLSKYYKVNINASEALSEDVDVFQVLEQMATYILNTDEARKMDDAEKKVYIFHNQRMDKYLNREKSNVATKEGSENLVDAENVVHALLAKKTNSRKLKIQTIKPEDLKRDDYVGEVLRDYQIFLDHINNKLHEEKGKYWRAYSRQKHLVQQDMIDAKDMLLGVWGYNSFIKESHVPDTDIFDFTDYNTVSYLLSYNCPDSIENEEMWMVWQDFFETVKKANLTKQEAEIVIMLQQNWKIQEISDETGIKYHSLYQTVIPRIIKKIMKVGNKYDCEDLKNKTKVQNRKQKTEENNNGRKARN